MKRAGDRGWGIQCIDVQRLGNFLGENLDGLDGNLLLNKNLDEELPN